MYVLGMPPFCSKEILVQQRLKLTKANLVDDGAAGFERNSSTTKIETPAAGIVHAVYVGSKEILVQQRLKLVICTTRISSNAGSKEILVQQRLKLYVMV